MHKHNNRFVVTLVRVTPLAVKVVDVLIPSIVIGSMTTMLYVVAVVFMV